MSKQNEQIRIMPTPTRRALCKDARAKEAGSLELTVQELDERIAPAKVM